jgi:hypothetical protein
MDHVLRSLAMVDFWVENAKKYMGEKYTGHICQDCASEASKSIKIICSCKTNWKCEKHIDSSTELPSEAAKEYIIAKCLAKPIETNSESKTDEDSSESKVTDDDASESKE